MWIGLLTTVIHPQLCKLRHELDEIEKAPCVSLTNSFLRDVVPASLDTRMHARYVQLGVSETDTPDAHLDSRLHGLLQKRRFRQAWSQKHSQGVANPGITLEESLYARRVRSSRHGFLFDCSFCFTLCADTKPGTRDHRTTASKANTLGFL